MAPASLRARGASIVDIRKEPEIAYAAHCREADIISLPLSDCLSYYNGHGPATPGRPSTRGPTRRCSTASTATTPPRARGRWAACVLVAVGIAIGNAPPGHPEPYNAIFQVMILATAWAAGVLISWVIAIAGTLIVLKICDALLGVRASRDEEIEGLDLSMHGEEGYHYEGQA